MDDAPRIISGWKRMQRCGAALALLVPALSFAQAIAVPPSQPGFFGAPVPTMTYLFEAKDAKVTLVFIPGGGGNFGIQPDWTDQQRYFSGPFNRMLRTLTDSRTTSGRTNLVIFDNPSDMPFRNRWSSARTDSSHLSRIEDVVRFYGEKLGKPIWLMGHSAGSISITALYKSLLGRKQEWRVAGLIYSAGVVGTSFDNESTRLPVLVMHHENDECVSTTPANAIEIHKRLQEGGNVNTDLVLLRTGMRAADGQNPCVSGFHMYSGAIAEASQAIDQFIGKHLEPR